MSEFFIKANSFAAPFVSDLSTKYLEAGSPEEALEAFAAGYSHPAGLYAAVVYASADAMHKGEPPLARWLCNHEQEKRRRTADKAGYGYLSQGPGVFEIDGERHEVEDPKGGSVVEL